MNIDNKSHDLPQIAGDPNNTDHFYLAWRHCDNGSCNYDATTGNEAANLSLRGLHIQWSGDSEPGSFAEIDGSLTDGPSASTGLQNLRLAVDSDRLCVASVRQNATEDLGKIYLLCHDALQEASAP